MKSCIGICANDMNNEDESTILHNWTTRSEARKLEITVWEWEETERSMNNRMSVDIYRDSCHPQYEWKESTKIPIFKKGDKQLPKNYYGIKLWHTTLNLTTLIVESQNFCCCWDKWQSCRQNHSYTHATRHLHNQMYEKDSEFNRKRTHG